MSAAPPSDLPVINVSAPGIAYAGQTVTVGWVVNNQGLNATSSDSWYDAVYLSTNGAFDANQNLLLGQAAHWGALAIGASYSNNATLALPASALPAGGSRATNYLFVYTDIADAVVELTKTNNLLEAPSPLVVLPAPPPGPADLAVTSVSAPSTIPAGGPASVFWTVTNEGPGATDATNWVDSVYLSPDGTFNSKVDIWLADIVHTGVLAPGDSYAVAQSISTPYCTTGSYFVMVVTDSQHQVNGSGALTNNVEASPNRMRILPSNAARHEPSSVSSASSVTAGAPLAVSWTVANFGNGTAGPQWTDGVFLSPSPAYVPGTGYLLGLYTNQSTLPAGQSYSHSGSYAVPPCFAGTYYVAVVTDMSNTVDGISCDTNNVRTSSASVQIVPSAYANLEIAAMNLPAAITSGVPWTLQWSVTNVGPGAAAGPWFDAVYASLFPALDGNAMLLGQFEHRGGLAARGVYAQDQVVQLPPCTAGQYYIFVATDVSNAVNVAACESNDAIRSSSAQPVSFGVHPDLAVTAISIPPAANAAQPMTLSWTVTNAGPVSANSPWVDAVYLSVGSTFSPANSLLLGYYAETAPLAPGGSRTQTASFTLPDIHGGFYVAVFTDATNAVQECENKTNYVAVSSATVNVPVTLYPDLKVTAVQVPRSALAGQPVTVTWVVTNEGTNSTRGSTWNDALYLSADELLDPSDLRLATFPNVSSLAVNQSYTNSATVVIPPGNAGPLYILALADSGGALYEHLGYDDSLGWNPNTMLVTLPPPADLAANHAALSPAIGVPGTQVTVGWTVSNVSSNNTSSTWADAIYLSTNNFWDITATLLANVDHTGLAAFGSYEGSWTGPLPASTPGPYYAIVRADVRNSVPELNLSNNVAVSSGRISVDVPVLALGQTLTNQLTTGAAQDDKVSCPAGQTVKITLVGSSPSSANELSVFWKSCG